MIEHTRSIDLKELFQEHLEQTRLHIDKLDSIAKSLQIPHKEKKDQGIDGLVQEGREMMKMHMEPTVNDVALIALAKHIEYYEIAFYETVIELAGLLQLDDSIYAFEQIRKEEDDMKNKLTALVRIYE